MPAQQRSSRSDGRGLGGNQSHHQRQHREAMARNTSPQGSNPRADVQPSQWDDADWDQDHDEAAGHRARRLLSKSNSGFHRLGDHFGALQRWLAGERWVKRLAIVIAALMVIFAGLAATPVAAQQSGTSRTQPLHAMNPSLSLSAPATSPLQQQMQDDYATQLRGAQQQLLLQNPSGLTRQERGIGHALNGFTPR